MPFVHLQVDSIPAVFGITLDPFIVYTSNMFAILSLRALYGFVSTIMTALKYLDKARGGTRKRGSLETASTGRFYVLSTPSPVPQAVAVVLGFIGIKMLIAFEPINIDVPTDVSLIVVALLLGERPRLLGCHLQLPVVTRPLLKLRHWCGGELVASGVQGGVAVPKPTLRIGPTILRSYDFIDQ